MIKAFVIIPAKADSKRLVGKNKRVIAGKTLIEHSIEYVKNSKLTGKVLLSTEDEETKNITESYGVEVVGRTKDYMGEREVADVYVNVIQNDIYNPDQHSGIKENGSILREDLKNVTHIVGVQPDHPDRKVDLDTLLEYAVQNKYDDLFTVDDKGTRNGSVRIMKKEFVESGEISRRVGSYVDNCTNVHSEQDLIDAEANIEIKERVYELGNEGE